MGLRKLSLNDLVSDLVDPSKPKKREIPKPVRLGLTIANRYMGMSGLRELPGSKKSAEKIQESMEFWEFKVTSAVDRTKRQIIDEDIKDFVKEVNRSDCDDVFIYMTGHGGYS